jgi:hypothetical protein
MPSPWETLKSIENLQIKTVLTYQTIPKPTIKIPKTYANVSLS